jgi:hypothetical protein
MEEDIVTVLRHNCDCTVRTGKCFSCECAEEIEQLRTKVDLILDRMQGFITKAQRLEAENTRLERLSNG